MLLVVVKGNPKSIFIRQTTSLRLKKKKCKGLYCTEPLAPLFCYSDNLGTKLDASSASLMSPVDHEAHGGHHGTGLKGLDSAILQSQLVCLGFVFVTCCITMYRGTAWHNDGWHLPMVAALFFSTCVLALAQWKGGQLYPTFLLSNNTLLLPPHASISLCFPFLFLTPHSYLKLTSREFQEDFHKR